MSATPVLHYGEVTPKDPIGRFNHRAKKMIRSLNGFGGKSNKRQRGQKTRTRKYKKH
jgi:hypothetical protein